jgi:zinc transporter 9
MAVSGTRSVTYAIIGNSFIAILKIIGYLASGSASLFGEAIHSIADTLNQALLLFGVKRSVKKADTKFTYGYGSERFLWALISACGIFFLGAGVTIYHGIEALSHAHEIYVSPLMVGILLTALIVESFTLYKAYEELTRHTVGDTFKEKLANGDPVTVAVVYEDTAAVMGVVFALISLALASVSGSAIYDAVGSIAIGILLGVIALYLIAKNREFLLGKAIPPHISEEIFDLIAASPYIEKVVGFQSEVLDVGRYHVKCEVEFNGAALLSEIIEQDDLREEYDALKDDFEEFKKFVVYQTNRIPRLIGRKIDEIEKQVHTKYPQVVSLDIELN